MDTLRVYWPGRFEGLVTINASDFDPEKHCREEEGPPDADAPKAKARRGKKSDEE